MKSTLLTIGIILLALGIIGLVANYSMTWMWLLIFLGIIGVLWGWMKKPEMR